MPLKWSMWSAHLNFQNSFYTTFCLNLCVLATRTSFLWRENTNNALGAESLHLPLYQSGKRFSRSLHLSHPRLWFLFACHLTHRVLLDQSLYNSYFYSIIFFLVISYTQSDTLRIYLSYCVSHPTRKLQGLINFTFQFVKYILVDSC